MLKKPRGCTHCDEAKALNMQLSRHCISVEHAIGGMKVARMLRDPLRNRAQNCADTVIVVAAGLYNFKCHLRDAAPAK